MAKHLPYLNALYFGANTYIDNFRTFFVLTLIWLVIWAITCALWFSVLKAFPQLMPAIPGTVSNINLDPYLLNLSMANLSLPSIIVSAILLFLVGLFYNLIYQYQLVRLSMALYKNSLLELSDLISVNQRDFYIFAGARLLLATKFILGFLALIAPGFYFVTKYFFAGFSLLDKSSSSIQDDTAFSAKLTEGLQWPMLFVVFMHGIAFAGLLPFALIALLSWTFYRPLSTLAEVHLYHTLKSTQVLPKAL